MNRTFISLMCGLGLMGVSCGSSTNSDTNTKDEVEKVQAATTAALNSHVPVLPDSPTVGLKHGATINFPKISGLIAIKVTINGQTFTAGESSESFIVDLGLDASVKKVQVLVIQTFDDGAEVQLPLELSFEDYSTEQLNIDGVISSSAEVVIPWTELSAAATDDSGMGTVGSIALSSRDSVSVLNWSKSEIVNIEFETGLFRKVLLTAGNFSYLLSSPDVVGLTALNRDPCELQSLPNGKATKGVDLLCALPLGIEVFVGHGGGIYVRNPTDAAYYSSGVSVSGGEAPKLYSILKSARLWLSDQDLVWSPFGNADSKTISFSGASALSIIQVMPFQESGLVALVEIGDFAKKNHLEVIVVEESGVRRSRLAGSLIMDMPAPLSVWLDTFAVATQSTEGLIIEKFQAGT